MSTRGGNAKLYYETTGKGVPVLLVMGLGMPASGWWRAIPMLSERLRVIAFDNRGSGCSNRPPVRTSPSSWPPTSSPVIDAADVERAHVYGISMGGIQTPHPATISRAHLGGHRLAAALRARSGRVRGAARCRPGARRRRTALGDLRAHFRPARERGRDRAACKRAATRA